MNRESKNLSTAENLSVDLDAEFRKSVKKFKLRVYLLFNKTRGIWKFCFKRFDRIKPKNPTSTGQVSAD